jgi:hypothetical protein
VFLMPAIEVVWIVSGNNCYVRVIATSLSASSSSDDKVCANYADCLVDPSQSRFTLFDARLNSISGKD